MKAEKNIKINNLLYKSKSLPIIMIIGIILFFTFILYPGLITRKHGYQAGDIAKNDVRAPKVFYVEDVYTTEKLRQEAEESVLRVYDFDTNIAKEKMKYVKLAFDQVRLRLYSKPAPKQIVEKKKENKDNVNIKPISPENKKKIDYTELKENFEKTIGISVSEGAFDILEKNKFSDKIANMISIILKKVLDKGVVENKQIFQQENKNGIILKYLGAQKEKEFNNLKIFYGIDQAKTMVRIVGKSILKKTSYTLINLIVDFDQRLIEPNIEFNIKETQLKKAQAAKRIMPVLLKIKKGEILINEGEKVSTNHLLKLNAMQSQMKRQNVFARSIGISLIMLCLFFTTYILNQNNKLVFEQNRNKNLFFILTVLITFLFIAKIFPSLLNSNNLNNPFSFTASNFYYIIPLAAGSMLICLFIGFNAAIPFSLILSLCTAIIFNGKIEIFIFFFISSTMAAYWIQNCRERKAFIKASLRLSLLNIILAISINIYTQDYSPANLFGDCIFALIGGVLAGIVATGITPFIELAFGYTTDIKLLELANLDQPIIRRLMLEAPGTYHHSIVVASLVEAAAVEIGANSLLAKVCGYYHDIGKVTKPYYFIENQKNGINKHDKLAPSMSRNILIAHVKDGVKIATEYKLGKLISDAIKQHHGTSTISYFYKKAQKQKGDESVDMDDYRYHGPKPKTKENALVMLADVVEAASRTLENPTSARIKGLVQELINKVFSDGQLDNCELTLKDLHKIARTFINMLSGMHHHRIEYVETQSSTSVKEKNGNINKEQTKKNQDRPEENAKQDSKHLKRLGL